MFKTGKVVFMALIFAIGYEINKKMGCNTAHHKNKTLLFKTYFVTCTTCGIGPWMPAVSHAFFTASCEAKNTSQ